MSAPRLTFFVELASDALASLFARAELPQRLERNGWAVSMGLLDLTPERAEVVRELETRGIPVTAWLLLDVDKGYWLNADNPEEACARYRDTIAWAQRESVRLHRVGLDVEFPRQDGELLMRRGAKGLLTLLRRRRTREQVTAAERVYADLIAEIRRGGRGVESYHFPQILDERSAGSTLLRRTLGLVDVGVDADVYMLYSSYLGRLGARAYFADAGLIALGVTGGGVNAGQPGEAARVLTWERFEDDLLAAAAHAREVYVFSLEGCVEQDFLPRIEALDWNREPAPLSPAEQRRLRRPRRFARAVLHTERLLDVVYPSRRR